VRFPLLRLHEGEALPDTEFWDAEKTLPKAAKTLDDVRVVVVYGPPGEFKTTACITDALDANAHGAKVVFAEGEGTHDFSKNRMPVAVKARGLTTRDFENTWRTCPTVPLLTDSDDVGAFIETLRPFGPDIVYLDTLAAASGDTDENSGAFGQLLLATGPIGRIAFELRCTVVAIHHSGKDVSKGSRGHSSLKGNAFGMCLITADKALRTAKKEVEKMRGGEDDFLVGYRISPRGQIPVATKIGRIHGHGQLGGETAGKAMGANLRAMEIGEQLREHGYVGKARGLTYREFAELRVELEDGKSRPPEGSDGFAAFTIKAEDEEAALRNLWTNAEKAAERKKNPIPNPFAEYRDRDCRPGARRSVWVWFAPER